MSETNGHYKQNPLCVIYQGCVSAWWLEGRIHKALFGDVVVSRKRSYIQLSLTTDVLKQIHMTQR